MLMTAEFWVAAAFVMFGLVVVYAGAHKAILSTLDGRAARIKAELEDASRLKQEAAALLAEYKRKTANAEQEAAAIIEGAKADAERLAAEAHAKLEEFVARRTKMAESKIAQAESQALADVRSIAADVAATAAEKVMTLAAKGALADQLVARGIDDVKKKLN
jgi:F-type H+-transporting ATPase subunit b